MTVRSGSGAPAGNEIRKRKSPAKPAFRPAGIVSIFEQNSRLIDGVKQYPARTTVRGRGSLFPLFRNPRNPGSRNHDRFSACGDKQDFEDEEFRLESSGFPQERNKRERRFHSFAIPAIPAAVIFLLALGVFFVNYGQGGAFDWMDRQVVNTGDDKGGQYNMALYAGVDPKENAPAQDVNGKTSSDQNSGDAIPLDLMETFAWQSYKVKKGDSVSKIAAAFSVSMDAIIASNGIANARALKEGETLRIPNMDGVPYTVKSGDTLSKISQNYGVPLEAILDANNIQSDVINAGLNIFIPGARMNREDLKLALGELFIYPLKGSRLSSPFGWRNDPFTGVRSYHAALDLAAPLGTRVNAAMDGTVSATGYNGTYGNFIIMSHSGNYQTMYAHLTTILVKKGEHVNQGIQIGTVGTTGYSTGPHLHFAVFKNGKAVNPLDLLSSQK